MTKENTAALIEHLKLVFDIVRLVDPAMTAQYSITGDGEMVREPYQCYAVWNKDQRCENCISARAFIRKSRMTKFEFIDSDVYHVTSMYLEVENTPYMLEMVTKVTDDTLFHAQGKNDFVKTISDFNEKLYMDALTGAYNRRYYDEQLSGLTSADAIAMLDVDNFKEINDHNGHHAGDLALQAIVKVLLSYTRSSDAVVRYGGDEFLIAFWKIPRDVFAQKLENIRKSIHETPLEGYPDVVLSVSIGGAYCWKSPKDAILEADSMLYKAKARKNHVEVV